MRSGEYGEFKIQRNNRTEWATWKADDNAEPIFSRIHVGEWNGPFDLKLIFDGIILNSTGDYAPYDYGIWLHRAQNVHVLNSKIITTGWRTASKGIFIDLSVDTLIDNCTITGNGTKYFGGFAYGISGGGDNNIIRNCEIDQARAAMQIIGLESNFAEDWTIENNHLFDMLTDGIAL